MAEYYELAVFFDISKISGRDYEAQALKVLAQNCSPLMLRNCQLYSGECRGPSPQSGRMFCIAVRTTNAASFEYLKTVFGALDDPLLAPPVDRIRESEIISKSRLKYWGRIDADGRFVTKEWRRSDHDICKTCGWAYLPTSYPPYLAPDVISEIERMGEPGFSLGAQKPSEKQSGRLSGSRRKGHSAALMRQLLYGACGVVILLLIFWSVSAGGRQYLGQVKRSVSERLQLGDEAYEKRNEGYALAAIRKIPHELDADDLNQKLGQKLYHVVETANSPLADVWLECSVWFSTNEVFRPDPQTVTQAFIKMDMRALDDSLVWTCLANGTRSAPGKEDENADLRVEALRTAIAQIDMTCLPDGKSVRDFQEQRDFDGLRNLLARLRQKQDELGPENVTRQEWEAFRRQLLDELANQWVMTQRMELTSGASFDAIILEEQGELYRCRIAKGFASIPKAQVKTVAPLTKEHMSRHISGLLSAGMDSASRWKKQICEEVVDKCSEQCIQYGIYLPGTCVVDMRFEGPGNFEAVVKTQNGERLLGMGGDIEGYKVVGLDPETSCILVSKGAGGEILRIWPESAREL